MLKIGVEGWQSGLMRRTRNAVGEKSLTGSNPVPSELGLTPNGI